MTDKPNKPQANNPLHGIKLETIVTQLSEHYGWEELAKRIDIRCFSSEPSVKSSLKFLRKTLWARTKVEDLYIRTRFKHGSQPAAKNTQPEKTAQPATSTSSSEVQESDSFPDSKATTVSSDIKLQKADHQPEKPNRQFANNNKSRRF